MGQDYLPIEKCKAHFKVPTSENICKCFTDIVFSANLEILSVCRYGRGFGDPWVPGMEPYPFGAGCSKHR